MPSLGVLVEERADGVGDLAAAAVPDRDVDEHAVDVGVASSAALSRSAVSAGSRSSAPDRLDPPAPLVGERVDGLLDDAAAAASSSLGGPVEVVGREQPQRDDLDADLLAPAQQRLDVRGPGAVALRGVGADGPAHRRLPSSITPTCLGRFSVGIRRSMRDSYAG